MAAAGLRAALEWRKDVDLWQTEQTLMGYLLPRLAELPNVKVYVAPTEAEQAGVVSLNVKGFRANEVAAILDQHHDIAVRAGHHCAALIHRHLEDKTYDGTVRVSVGAFTTKADLDALVDALRGLDRAKLKGIAPDILRGNC